MTNPPASPSPPTPYTPIAIIGAGLCGLTLSLSLTSHSLPYTIYESRPHLTELGHGINVGPNFLTTLHSISPQLSAKVLGICSRNPVGKEDVWMEVRLGAGEREGKKVGELVAGGTGNMTCRRDELLRVLGEGVGGGMVEFGRKVVGVDYEGGEVRFEDGGCVRAGVIVGCDGIHSVVRREVFGGEFDARYADSGAYRGLLDLKVVGERVGSEIAGASQIFVGPEGYIIMYPIAGGEKVNVGMWHWRRSSGIWEGGRTWLLEKQGEAMREQFRDWGKTAHVLMDLIGDTPFWATHTHTHQPVSMTKGRACVIGDSMHSMPPHQGAGAGQAVEDAYVLAQVLNQLDWSKGEPARNGIEAALKGFESVRFPRSQKVLETSHEALSFWTDLYHEDLSQEEIDEWIVKGQERFGWIWNPCLPEQVSQAVEDMQRRMKS